MVLAIVYHPLPSLSSRRQPGTQQPRQPPTVIRIVWPPYLVSVLEPSLRGQHKAALEQIETGTAKHLAFKHF